MNDKEPVPSPVRLALIGLMGSGKTRLGRDLGLRLQWPFADADALLTGAAGASIGELFATEGEARFREREAAILGVLANRPAPLVVATGGGVVERDDNRALLNREFTVVWLRIAPQEAFRRVGHKPDRPLLAGGDPSGVLHDLSRRREPLYRALADLTLDTDVDTVTEDLMEAVVEFLAKR